MKVRFMESWLCPKCRKYYGLGLGPCKTKNCNYIKTESEDETYDR